MEIMTPNDISGRRPASDRWRMGFHLTPPAGWMNDPNGLCEKDGIYHVYHQYRPSWPRENDCCWGHFTSRDLVHWTHRGVAIERTLPEESDGVWSGSAIVVDGIIHVFYTANRRHLPSFEGEFDFVHTGRDAVQFHASSRDGMGFSDKRPIITNDDSPEGTTRHVRDPKVWYQDGTWHMVLGARMEDDRGVVFLFCSDDLESWTYERTLSTPEAFGYMWECPDRIALSGHEFLAACPQGLPSEPMRFTNHDNSGYFILDGSLLSTGVLDPERFFEWDAGFDFYAPQSFEDGSGRTILFAWMGEPSPAYTSTPEGCDFWYCLTVPRLLTLAEDGTILQTPVPELDALHRRELTLGTDGRIRLECPRADIRLEGISGAGSIRIDGGLVLSWDGETLRLRFEDAELGAGRDERVRPLGELGDLRILVDNSAVEIFVNGGGLAMATRFFPRTEGLEVELACNYEILSAYEMGDGIRS